jgi:hypothetical protein
MALQVVFFVLPEVVQKPFRICIGLLFLIIYVTLLIKKQVKLSSLLLMSGLIITGFLIFLNGTLETAYINSLLCAAGFFVLNEIKFEIDPLREKNLNILFYICCLSIIIQFLIFRHNGRPKLSYEINLSGAYLFLFFLLSDALGKKSGKFLVIILSLLILSRLLIFSILLFYLARYLKKLFRPIKLNYVLIMVCAYLFISLFSVWFVMNNKPVISYDEKITRVTTLNDNSNYLRFATNSKILLNIATRDKNLVLGYGNPLNSKAYFKQFFIMPHNELFDFLIEFGLVALILFIIISTPVYSKVFNYENLEYFLPLILYTLLLWFRVLLIPSFEAIFVLLILNFRTKITGRETR